MVRTRLGGPEFFCVKRRPGDGATSDRVGFFRGIGSDHSRPGRSGLTAPLPVASPREAELRSGWLLSAVRGGGVLLLASD